MGMINIYFPTIQYEEELEKRKDALRAFAGAKFDPSTGIRKISMPMGWEMSVQEDTPNDFDISKFELVGSIDIPSVNSIEDFDKFAEANPTYNYDDATASPLRREVRNGDIIEINNVRHYCLTHGWKII